MALDLKNCEQLKTETPKAGCQKILATYANRYLRVGLKYVGHIFAYIDLLSPLTGSKQSKA